jgi:hypothetical protein
MGRRDSRKEPPVSNEQPFAVVIETLAGIGLHRIRAELRAVFAGMIWSAIHMYENANGGRRVKALRAVANEPSLDLLVVLWDLEVCEKCDQVRPVELAKRIKAAIQTRFEGPRMESILADAIQLFDGQMSIDSLRRSLLLNQEVLREKSTIKRAIMSAASGLQVLGLVEMKNGNRGKQSVTAGLCLTPRGRSFVRALLQHAISASADYHPASPSCHPQ